MNRLNLTDNLNQQINFNSLNSPEIKTIFLVSGENLNEYFENIKALAFQAFPPTELKYSFNSINWINLAENNQYWISGLNKWSGYLYLEAVNDCEIQFEIWY